jgi:hypothetical protein
LAPYLLKQFPHLFIDARSLLPFITGLTHNPPSPFHQAHGSDSDSDSDSGKGYKNKNKYHRALIAADEEEGIVGTPETRGLTFKKKYGKKHGKKGLRKGYKKGYKKGRKGRKVRAGLMDGLIS